ncbi:MAG: DUF98 domain-containing protein [Euryarchaeota archaeon]|nr:DUF98 domain-containing protein [Euryarchaeota archaeon]
MAGVFPLTRVQRILLTTDGSVTRILEALRGEPIRVETELQEVVEADQDTARLLGVEEGAEVNYRVVRLLDSRDVLVHATSYAPLGHLREEFREDIMKRDTPIGRIMQNLKIEARREIRDFGVLEAGEEEARALGVPAGTKLLWREYDIISGGRTLLHIREVFSGKI